MDTQPAGKRAGMRTGQCIRFVNILQDLSDAGQIGLARFGQRHTPRRPLKQTRSQIRLQLRDQSGDHGGRHVHGPARCREAAFVCHPLENSH